MKQDTMFNNLVNHIVTTENFKRDYKEFQIGSNLNNFQIENYGLDMVNLIKDHIESRYDNKPENDIIVFSMGYYKVDFYNACIAALVKHYKLNEEDLRIGSDSFFYQ